MASEPQLITGIAERSSGETTLSIHGEIDAANVASLSAALSTAIHGSNVVTVDFSGVEFIDSSGIRCLLQARLEANRSSVDMRVVEVRPQTMHVLTIAGVGDFLSCQPAAAPLDDTTGADRRVDRRYDPSPLAIA